MRVGATAAVLLLMVAGCTDIALTPMSTTPNGQPAQPGQQAGGEQTMPPDAVRIPNIPIPPDSRVIMDRTVLVGSDDSWTGQVGLRTNFTGNQVVEFLRAEMPRYGWTETAIVRSRVTSIAFIRDRRFAVLRVNTLDRGGAEVDMMVAPASASGVPGKK
ncbi:MAG TPA: hypothetical protein VEH84_17735 [Alphaproteobacteria bacterium]|nr:hypothetical protein [Alphaproteobacteria bacterium]